MIPAAVKDLLAYDPMTGRFTWRINQGSRARAGKTAGTLDPRGYVRIQLGGKLYWAHRLAFFLMTGREPVMVDHINQRPGDNRWGNLREVTGDQNAANGRLRIDNQTGSRGVFWNARRRQFQAYITSFQKKTHLGWFTTFEEARAARDEAEQALFGRYGGATERMEVPDGRA